MANTYANIYGGNPTAGAVDGMIISTDDTELSPLAVNLDASANENKTIKLAIRTTAGYEADSGTIITAEGVTASMWSFCATENGTFGDSLTMATALDSVNTIFYAKASSSSLESPGKDNKTNIVASVPIILSD